MRYGDASKSAWNYQGQPGTRWQRFVATFLSRLNESAGMGAETLARRLGPVSYGEAEQFCLDLLRRQVLGMGEQPLKAIVAEQLKLWSARVDASDPNKEAVNHARTSTPEPPRA